MFKWQLQQLPEQLQSCKINVAIRLARESLASNSVERDRGSSTKQHIKVETILVSVNRHRRPHESP